MAIFNIEIESGLSLDLLDSDDWRTAFGSLSITEYGTSDGKIWIKDVPENKESEYKACAETLINNLKSSLDDKKSIKAMSFLRKERDRLLLITDWQATSDRTMTDEQTAYRKALRDLPATSSPELDSNGSLIGVTWPEKPE